MSIKIIVFITPKQETMPVLADWFSELRTKTLAENGCIQFDIYQHQEDFVLIEEWQDQEALDQHMLEPYTKEFIQMTDGKIENTSVYRLARI